MSLDEFEDFVISIPLVNDSLGQRDIPYCFNLALLSQVNEIDYDRHLHAGYIEFLEAFCRCVDKSSPCLKQTISLYDRKRMPLEDKILLLIPCILSGCMTKFFRDRFEHPPFDEEVGLFVLKTKKYF